MRGGAQPAEGPPARQTGPSPARRLLRSLVSLKQVIVNAAHYLVLGNKETYQFDPEVPFLHMVSPTPGSTGDPLVCVVPPQSSV